MGFLETYFDIFYILAVVLTTQVFNNYVTIFKKIDNRWTALLVSALVFGIFYWLGDPEEPRFEIRLFISFLASVAFYDFILKPVTDFLKSKFGKFGEDVKPDFNNQDELTDK